MPWKEYISAASGKPCIKKRMYTTPNVIERQPDINLRLQKMSMSYYMIKQPYNMSYCEGNDK